MITKCLLSIFDTSRKKANMLKIRGKQLFWSTTMSLDQKCSPTPPNPIDSTKHLSGDYESELSRILQAIKKTKSLSLSLSFSQTHTHIQHNY